MNKTIRDANGNILKKNIKYEQMPHANGKAWGVNIWFGGINGLGTNVRRIWVATRRQAREADISNYKALDSISL